MIRKTALCGAAVLALQLPLASAHAHEFHPNNKVAGTGSYCVYEQAMVREGTGGAESAGQVRTFRSDCQTRVNRDVSFLAQNVRIYYRANLGDQPRLCAYTNFYYNEQPTWSWRVNLSFNPGAYCGTGYYSIEGGGFLWADDDWRGGLTTTDTHFFNG